MITNFDTSIVQIQDLVVKKHKEVKELHQLAIDALNGEHSPRALPLCIKACEDYAIAKDQLNDLYAIFAAGITSNVKENDIREMATWAGIKKEFRQD